MKPLYHVEAKWDPEANVWISKSDIPGLVVEAETLAEFEDLVRALVPEILADNEGGDGGGRVELTSSRTFELADA